MTNLQKRILRRVDKNPSGCSPKELGRALGPHDKDERRNQRWGHSMLSRLLEKGMVRRLDHGCYKLSKRGVREAYAA